MPYGQPLTRITRADLVKEHDRLVRKLLEPISRVEQEEYRDRIATIEMALLATKKREG